jgi:hypothetical protein
MSMKDDSELTPDGTEKAEVSPVVYLATTRPTPDGTAFALAQLDEFELEVELLRKNPDFLGFLRELSREDASIPLEDLRKELAI